MTSSRTSTVLRVLFVFWPFVVFALLLVVLAVAFFAAMVVQAFGEGFDVGCAALAALIGIPSLGLLWLSSAMKLFGRKPIPQAPPARSALVDDMAARYAAGDFIHRDYEEERRAWSRDG